MVSTLLLTIQNMGSELEAEGFLSTFIKRLVKAVQCVSQPFDTAASMNVVGMSSNQGTTGFYMAKLDEIGYTVCSSSSIDVYEQWKNPEFQNPAIGGIWEKRDFVRSNGNSGFWLVSYTPVELLEQTV